MITAKVRVFDDETAPRHVMSISDPAIQNRFGRGVRHLDDCAWEAACGDIVLCGTHVKFSENPERKKVLLDTGGRILTAALRYDFA